MPTLPEHGSVPFPNLVVCIPGERAEIGHQITLLIIAKQVGVPSSFLGGALTSLALRFIC